jgi:hypothetical protein
MGIAQTGPSWHDPAGNGNQIISSPDGRNATLLNRRRDRVLGQGDVVGHGRVERQTFEGAYPEQVPPGTY